MTRRPPLVIVHGACFDGFTSAWLFSRMHGDAEFVHARYGDPKPDCHGRDVWVLDFSYPRDVMKEIIVESLTTTVLDHHKTAQAALDGILQEIRQEKNVNRTGDRIVFDMERSGAGITFDVLEAEQDKKRGFKTPRLNGQRKTRLVDYIEDRDLWLHKLPWSEAVSAWVAATPMTFEAWDELAGQVEEKDVTGEPRAVTFGVAILRYMEVYGEHACDEAHFEVLSGHHVPVMNLPYMNCSEHVTRLLGRHPDAPFAAGYFQRADGKWQFSLRSRSEFDVSEVAKAYGGGGHKGAAGFELSVLPWEAEKHTAGDGTEKPAQPRKKKEPPREIVE